MDRVNTKEKTMQIQISSGQGPIECELAVAKLAHSLCKEFADTSIKQVSAGYEDGCYRSVIIESKQDLSFLDGSIKWICQSPMRPGHKRKNWFVDISLIANFEATELDSNLIRYDTFRSGGKGGQNVNKVESGVRATYLPTGISTTSTDERSQYMNKKVVFERLCKMIDTQNLQEQRKTEQNNWKEHNRLVRGNAIRVYKGLEFKRIK